LKTEQLIIKKVVYYFLEKPNIYSEEGAKNFLHH
jgi:hypothetical protein